VVPEGGIIIAAWVPGSPGEGLLDASCGSTDDCAAGLFCYLGSCRFHCCTEVDCADGQFCSFFESAGFCGGDDGCDIFSADGCGADQGCYPLLLERGGWTPTCVSAGAGQAGDACASVFECAPGTICIGDQLSAQCAVLCDAGHPCESGECAPIVGDPGYGFCR